MEGVQYAKVALAPPFVVAPPIVDNWLLYIARTDGIEFSVGEGIQTRLALNAGTVIAMSGTIAHKFSGGAFSANTKKGWEPLPLSEKTEPSNAVITIGSVPRTRVPFLAMPNAVTVIDPRCQPDLAARVGMLMGWIEQEQQRDEAGSTEIIRRLSEVITLEVGRFELSRRTLVCDLPSGDKVDPRIWRAIAAFSHKPEQQWTVERMADVANMSRTAFAVHFRKMVGMSPLKSLRQLRMQRASSALAMKGTRPVGELAHAMGYGSEAAFCRAFAKEFGMPPGRYGQQETMGASV